MSPKLHGILSRLLAANVLAVAGVIPFGCQLSQKATVQRSEKCGAMCAKAREARANGNTDLANQCIDEALRQRPSDAETRRQLADTMWNTGRRDEAIAVYSSLIEQQPSNTKLVARLAVMQWESGQHVLAAKLAAEILSRDAESKDAWHIKARYEVDQNQLDEALASYGRLSQLAPDDAQMLVELGELHMRRGNPDRACPMFQAASQQSQAAASVRADAEWLLGVAYARSRRWSLAVPVLEAAIRKRTPSADDWCFLGWTRLQCGDVVGAQSDLNAALERDPKSEAAQTLAMQLSSLEKESVFVTPTAFRESLGNDAQVEHR